jgi:spore germination cell wall hydrolase CwlJ-like protein
MLRKLLAVFAAGMLSYSSPLHAQQAPGTLPVVSETTIPTTAPAAELIQPAVVNNLSQVQVETPPVPQPVAQSVADPKQAECVAKAIYFESKGEPLKGQKAVGYVVLNRAKSGRFATTPCKVIAQPYQFSWYRYGKAIPTNVKTKFVALAQTLMETYSKDNDPSNGALFFHATYVSPGWRGVTRLERIGGHIFYR